MIKCNQDVCVKFVYIIVV